MARRPAALEQPGGQVWVVGRYSPPTFGGPLRLAHRNFDAGRPVREAQRSVVVVRWAVLDGHKPESTSGRFGAVHLSEFAGAPLRACRDFIERVRLTASLLCRNARPAHNRTAHRNPPAEALVDLGSNLALLLQGEPTRGLLGSGLATGSRGSWAVKPWCALAQRMQPATPLSSGWRICSALCSSFSICAIAALQISIDFLAGWPFGVSGKNRSALDRTPSRRSRTLVTVEAHPQARGDELFRPPPCLSRAVAVLHPTGTRQ